MWTFLAFIVMLALYVAALSSDFYKLTSPPTFTWHVALRKTYSIAAFTIVGILYVKMLDEFGRKATIVHTILAIGMYSAAIEVGQALVGSHEGRLWNTLDVLCGAIGGAFAWYAGRYVSKSG